MVKQFLSAVFALFVATTVNAQDFSLPPMIGGDVAVGLAAQAHIQRSEQERAKNSAASTSADFTFRSDPGRTQQNLQNFIRQTDDPAAKADLQQLVRLQPDIIDLIGDAIRPYGLNPHDVADTYAVWWINSWLVSQMRNEDVDRATVQAVQAQVRAAMQDVSEFEQTSDAERQTYAEALLLTAALLDAAIDQAGNDRRLLETLAQAAKQSAINTGVDLTTMVLTQDGFQLQ